MYIPEFHTSCEVLTFRYDGLYMYVLKTALFLMLPITSKDYWIQCRVFKSKDQNPKSRIDRSSHCYQAVHDRKHPNPCHFCLKHRLPKP